MPKLTDAVIDAAIRGFEAQKNDIDAQIAELRAMKTGAPVRPTPTRPRKTETAEAECGSPGENESGAAAPVVEGQGGSVSSGAKAPAKKAAAAPPKRQPRQPGRSRSSLLRHGRRSAMR